MMHMYGKPISWIVLLFITPLSFAQNWEQITDFPSTERDDGVVFQIGNKIYCGTGLNSSFSTTGDFHAFDAATDTWFNFISLPSGEERQYAAGSSNGTEGFVIGGINGSTYLNDVWVCNTILGNWVEKSPLPSVGRFGSSFFTIDSIVYIIGGRTASNLAIDEVWAYDMVNDSWEMKSNLPFGARWRASATAINGTGYLTFGRDENNRYCNELYSYSPISDSWILLNTFPQIGRSYCSMQNIQGDLVIIAGLDTLGNSHNDMWRYVLATDTWQELNPIPSAGRRGGMCFTDASTTTLYYTTGINSTSRLRETWKCNNPTGINENQNLNELVLYPNPAKDVFQVNLSNTTILLADYQIIGTDGKEYPVRIKYTNEFDSSQLPAGVYTLKCFDKESQLIAQSKFIVSK